MDLKVPCLVNKNYSLGVEFCGDNVAVVHREAFNHSSILLSQKDAIDLAQAILKHYEVLQPDPERDEIVEEGDDMPEEVAMNVQHEIEDFGTW